MHDLGISVVVPVFASAETLPLLVERIADTLGGRFNFEVLLVDDGSRDTSWSIITALGAQRPNIVGIRLSRNYGQHNALLAGIRHARLPIIVTLDDDLQNPPEEIPLLVDTLISNDLDVVYGVPQHPEHAMSRRLASRITKYALSHGLGKDSSPGVSSFRSFRTHIRDAFSGDIGTNVSVDALLTWGSSRFGSVQVQHNARLVGASNYTYGKLLRFALDTTTGYSARPLQAASLLGLATSFFGLVILLLVTIRPVISGESVPGFPFLAATIAIFSGVQLLTLGIMGEYLARMHFRLMRKPTYLVSETTMVRDASE